MDEETVSDGDDGVEEEEDNLTEGNDIDYKPIWTCFENLLLVVLVRSFNYDWSRVEEKMIQYNPKYPRETYSVSKCKFQLKKILETVGQPVNDGNGNQAGTSSQIPDTLTIAENHLSKQVAGIISKREQPDPLKEVDYLYYVKDLERLENMDEEIPEEELEQIALDATDDESESESSDQAINDMRILRRKIKAEREAKRIQEEEDAESTEQDNSVEVPCNSTGINDIYETQSSATCASSQVDKLCETKSVPALETMSLSNRILQSPVTSDVEPLADSNKLQSPITQSLPTQCNNQLNGICEQFSEPRPTVSPYGSVPVLAVNEMEENSGKLEDWKADLDKVCLPAKCEYFDSNDIDSIQATFVPDSDIIPQVEAADLMSSDATILPQEISIPDQTSAKANGEPPRSGPVFKIPALPVPKKISSPQVVQTSSLIVQATNTVEFERPAQENGAQKSVTSSSNGIQAVPKSSPPKRPRSKAKSPKSPKTLKIESNGNGPVNGPSGNPKSTNPLRYDPEFQAFRKSINLIHDRIMTHKHANLFKEPVRDSAVPGYSRIVKKPICMKSLKRNIETGVIRTTEMYQAEITQMFLNAVMVSTDDSEFRDIAISMAKDCVKILEEFKATQDLIKLKRNNEQAAECAGLTVSEQEDCLPGRSVRSTSKRSK